jgi:hypothetical protein
MKHGKASKRSIECIDYTTLIHLKPKNGMACRIERRESFVCERGV